MDKKQSCQAVSVLEAPLFLNTGRPVVGWGSELRSHTGAGSGSLWMPVCRGSVATLLWSLNCCEMVKRHDPAPRNSPRGVGLLCSIPKLG